VESGEWRVESGGKSGGKSGGEPLPIPNLFSAKKESFQKKLALVAFNK
jgi:hypothetical protein